MEKAQHAVDRFQQRRPWLGYVIGAWKKFSDDQAGNLAALISYYAFASVFPLLLVLYTVLDLVLIGHQLKTNSAYGTFGVVLGLLAWFYLEAQLTLYAVEFDIVRVRQLWPRSMFPPPLTDADVRAYQMYAAAQQRRPELAVVLQRSDQPAEPDQPAVRGGPVATGSGAGVSTTPAAADVTGPAGAAPGAATAEPSPKQDGGARQATEQ